MLHLSKESSLVFTAMYLYLLWCRYGTYAAGRDPNFNASINHLNPHGIVQILDGQESRTKHIFWIRALVSGHGENPLLQRQIAWCQGWRVQARAQLFVQLEGCPFVSRFKFPVSGITYLTQHAIGVFVHADSDTDELNGDEVYIYIIQYLTVTCLLMHGVLSFQPSSLSENNHVRGKWQVCLTKQCPPQARLLYSFCPFAAGWIILPNSSAFEHFLKASWMQMASNG